MSDGFKPGLRAALAASALAALAIGLQSNALGAWFVGDDLDFLLGIGSLAGPWDVVTYSFWGEWEPLWHLSWFVDQRVWGLDPVGFHVTNTVLLAACAIALFALVRVVWPASRVAAWAAALLFLVHPLHDEAVVYLAARGHPMALALALTALACQTAAWRRSPGRDRAGLVAAGLVAATLAGLAKETALVLPAWVFVVEWLLGARPGRLAAFASAARRAALFVVPVVTVILLRALAVGLGSDKLTGGFDAPLRLGVAIYRDVPLYALLVGLPLPFAFVDYPVVQALAPAGWALVMIAAVTLGLGLRRSVRAGGPLPGHWVLHGLGLAVAAAGLFPVLWADLSIRRRYGFVPSAGVVLVAAAWLECLWTLRRRTAAGLLGVLLAAGAVGSLARNSLWVGAGEVIRGLYDDVRSLSPERRLAPDPVVLITLPRAWRGDFLSGAYLLHSTDLLSLLELAGAPPGEAQYALDAYHADDYRARILRTPDGFDLEVRFRSAEAWRAALERDPASDGAGHLAWAERIAADPAERLLRYRLSLLPPLAARVWLVYADGDFVPLPVPPEK